jgi:HK97 family phage major capsid protein
MTNIDMLRKLIEKESDETKRGELEDELVKAIEERAAEKVRAEMEEQAQKDKEKAQSDEMRQAAKTAEGSRVPSIEIPSQPASRYKSPSGVVRNLKAELGVAKSDNRVSPVIQASIKSNPKLAEKIFKDFGDSIYNAYHISKSPFGVMQKDLTEATEGELTPTEQRMEILSYIRENSMALQYATVVPMISDVQTVPRETASVSVKWEAEADPITESTPTFDQVTLTAKRLTGYTQASREVLDDAGADLVGVLLSQFTEAAGQKIDDQVFSVTTTGSAAFSGVFSAKAGYSEVFSSGSTAFSELLASNMRGVIGKIPSSRLRNARWFMHRTVAWDHVMGLTDSDGRPLFMLNQVDGPSERILGYPYTLVEEAPSTSAAATGFILFGDLRGFYIGERLGNMEIMTDPYSAMSSGLVNFYFFNRWAFAHGLPKMYARIVTAAT